MLYTIDSRRRTYAEHWRLSAPSFRRFLAAAACKLLGIRQPSSFGVRRPDGLEFHSPPDVPASVLEALTAGVARGADVGLAFQFYASVNAVIGGRAKGYLAAMLHRDGRAWATAMAVWVWNRAPVRIQPAKFNCFSLLPDERYLVTSDHSWKLEPNPGDLVENLVGSSVAEVADRHARRAAESEAAPVLIRPADLAGVILTREQRHLDYQVGRGIYVPMSAEELERINRKR